MTFKFKLNNVFDTHCHLNLKEYFPEPTDTINHAFDSGVTGFIVPGTDFSTSKIAVRIAEDFENVFAAVGIHPTEKLEKMNLDHFLFNLEELIKKSKKIVGVGEIGLDYYHLNTIPSVQKEFLVAQIKLALKYDKSIIIHNRMSSEDLVVVLNQIGLSNFSRSTVFHCCEPNFGLLKLAEKEQIYIGVDGDITYDKNKQEFIKNVPLELLVLETDSPFLIPEPLRSKGQSLNKPENLRIIASKIADIKKRKIDDIIKITTDNSKKLFVLRR